MGPHTFEVGLAIGMALACIVMIVQASMISNLRRKNEAQRLLLEAPPTKPQPAKPSRIRIYVRGGSHVVYGTRLKWSEGRLTVVDEEDKLAAVFGPGWIAALVEQEPQEAKTPAPKPIEPPKEAA